MVRGDLSPARGRVTVTGNEIEGICDVVVSANWFRNPRDSARPALELVGESATVQGNRARGGEPSMDLRVDPKRVAVVANLVSTLVVVDGAPLGSPWDVLNPGEAVKALVGSLGADLAAEEETAAARQEAMTAAAKAWTADLAAPRRLT